MSTIHPHAYDTSRSLEALAAAWKDADRAARAYQADAERLAAAGLHVIAHAFRFTAAQEGEHRAILRGLMQGAPEAPAQAATAETIAQFTPELLLKQAIRREEECADCLTAAAQAAREEGRPRAALALERIRETEALHARRFRQYLSAFEEGTLFHSPCRTGWLCLACGGRHYGCEAPEGCESCGKGRGHFIRGDFFPFAV